MLLRTVIGSWSPIRIRASTQALITSSVLAEARTRSFTSSQMEVLLRFPISPYRKKRRARIMVVFPVLFGARTSTRDVCLSGFGKLISNFPEYRWKLKILNRSKSTGREFGGSKNLESGAQRFYFFLFAHRITLFTMDVKTFNQQLARLFIE